MTPNTSGKGSRFMGSCGGRRSAPRLGGAPGSVQAVSRDRAVIPMTVTRGGAFGEEFDPDRVVRDAWGELELVFAADDVRRLRSAGAEITCGVLAQPGHRALSIVVFALYSLPSFFAGTLLVQYFATGEHWQWFPNGGFESTNADGFKSVVETNTSQCDASGEGAVANRSQTSSKYNVL